jgi:hypothetical protein
MLPCSQMSGGYTPQKAYDAVPQLHLETNKDAVVGWSGLRRHRLTAIASSKLRQGKAAGTPIPDGRGGRPGKEQLLAALARLQGGSSA